VAAMLAFANAKHNKLSDTT